MPEMREEGSGMGQSRYLVSGSYQTVAKRCDVGGADLAAAADDVETGLDPAQREVGIGLRIEVVAGVQHVHRAAVLERFGGGEAVGIGADRRAEAFQRGQRRVDGLRPLAVNLPRGQRQVRDGRLRLRQRLAAAQARAGFVGERP